MSQYVPTLTPQQRAAIDALLIYGEVKAAARQAKVSRNTLYTWLKDETFQAALKEAEKIVIEAGARVVANLVTKAAETLREAMDDQTAALATRVRAADVVLARSIQLRAHADIEERLAAVEAAQAAGGRDG